MTWLAHVTLSTGHKRRSERSEVDDAAVAACDALLSNALASGAPVPLVPEPLAHYAIEAVSEGRRLLATLHAPAGPHIAGQPHRGPTMPIATFGVALKSRDGAKLWTMLGQQAGVAASPQPPAPWCGAILYPTLGVHSDAAAWLGDFERCLAWAWIERHDR